MKTSKNLIKALAGASFAILLLLIMQPAWAQNPQGQAVMQAMKDKTPEQRAQMQTNLMKTKLNLDTFQTVKVQAINLKYAQKMDPLLKGGQGKLAMFRQMKSINSDKDAELKGVFTPVQYKQYQDFEAEMKEKIKDYASKQKN